jgi:pyrimidine operon attenuation protein / uracil phosphoribosyltransferase
MSNSKVVLDGPDIARTIVRIAHQIVEQTEGRDIAIVGIHRRGAVLARRLVAQVSELVGQEIPLGEIDISF